MITSINKFKKINENNSLSLEMEFTPTIKQTWTVSDIISNIQYLSGNDNINEMDENDILSKLTPELCQEFVDSLIEIKENLSILDSDEFFNEYNSATGAFVNDFITSKLNINI